MNPSEAVVAGLRAHGVDLFFGLDGDHVIYLFNALMDAPDIRPITVKHENNAAIAAEVYGRLTGRPFAMKTAHFFRSRDGKLCEHWGVRDELDMLYQVGALTPPQL